MPHRVFNGLLMFLREQELTSTQAEQARALNLHQPQISAYSRRATVPTTPRWWSSLFRKVYQLGYKHGQRDTASKLMRGLVETFGQIPQAELASALGISQPAVSSWLRGSASPSKRNFERLLGLHVIRLVEPIIEFWPIDPQRNGQSWNFHPDADTRNSLHEKLKRQAGIYVFYDSAGRVTYIGKTVRCLWEEPKQRLKAEVNRDFYRPTKAVSVEQGEVARFLSAYRIRVPAAIHNLEVFMLRAVPNDSANINTGRFQSGFRRLV